MCKSTDVWHFFDTCFCSFIYLYALLLLTVHARASLFNQNHTKGKKRISQVKCLPAPAYFCKITQYS